MDIFHGLTGFGSQSKYLRTCATLVNFERAGIIPTWLSHLFVDQMWCIYRYLQYIIDHGLQKRWSVWWIIPRNDGYLWLIHENIQHWCWWIWRIVGWPGSPTLGLQAHLAGLTSRRMIQSHGSVFSASFCGFNWPFNWDVPEWKEPTPPDGKNKQRERENE